jgi:hypothetical protein
MAHNPAARTWDCCFCLEEPNGRCLLDKLGIACLLCGFVRALSFLLVSLVIPTHRYQYAFQLCIVRVSSMNPGVISSSVLSLQTFLIHSLTVLILLASVWHVIAVEISIETILFVNNYRNINTHLLSLFLHLG